MAKDADDCYKFLSGRSGGNTTKLIEENNV